MENGKMSKKIATYRSWKKELNLVQNIEGFLVPGQEKTLMVLASKVPENGTIVEIGSFKGKSTACLGLGSSKSVKIHAIDTFKGNDQDFFEGNQFSGGSFLDEFNNNLKHADVLKKVKPHVGFSGDIGKIWNKKIDLLFIDGSHVYKDVKKDFDLFYPWVKEGGIIALHDVSPGHPDVLRFWNKEIKKVIKNYSNVHTLYFGVKPYKNSSDQKLHNMQSIHDQATTEKVFIIIPVHNRLAFTKKCLKSVYSQKYPNIECIVVDDGSDDGTYKYIKGNYPDTTIIKGNGKWWWTRSINEGVNSALKKAESEDFVLTMNNDCFFDKNYISKLVKCSKDNKRSITGSFIVDPDKPELVLDAGVFIDWKNARIYGSPDKKPYIASYRNKSMTIAGIDTISGKGTLIPVEVFNKVGLFNSVLLPHYAADYEYFNRAKIKGINLIVSIESRLYNYSKETGTVHSNFAHQAKYKDVLTTLFSRKSKINILDHLFFIILRCPKKYLLKNFSKWFLKLLNYLLLLFPFYYFKVILDIYKKIRKRVSEK